MNYITVHAVEDIISCKLSSICDYISYIVYAEHLYLINLALYNSI